MDCSVADRQGGYTTAAFSAISLAIALVAAALVARAGAELKAARASFERVQESYRLDGALNLAAVEVMNQPGSPRLRWRVEIGGAAIEVLAEPEASKVHPRRAAEILDDPVFQQLGISQISDAGQRLRTAGLTGTYDREALLRVGSGPVWASCAASVMSPFGAAEEPNIPAAIAPAGSGLNWRVGEVWRLRAATAKGWVDDRIVRFTGDTREPAAIVQRRFERDHGSRIDCDAVLHRG